MTEALVCILVYYPIVAQPRNDLPFPVKLLSQRKLSCKWTALAGDYPAAESTDHLRRVVFGPMIDNDRIDSLSIQIGKNTS